MTERIETQTVDGQRLAVEFDRSADRFGHRVMWLDGDVDSTLLTSLEGTATDRSPPSPVLQQLHIEDRAASPGNTSNTSRVALLIGLAGRSHWSLSVEPCDKAAAFDFDVACRFDSKESIDLGSTYKPAVEDGVLQVEELALSLGGGLFAVVRGDAGTKLDSEDRGLIISPRELKVPTTRWKYRIELVRVHQ
jgi:hypothetical protein